MSVGQNGKLDQPRSTGSETLGNTVAGPQTELESPKDRSYTYSWNRIFLPLMAVGFLLVYGPTLGWLIKRWSLGVWYHSHGFLVLPISGYLIWRLLRRFPNQTPNASSYGFLFLVPALFLHVIDTALQSYLLSSISLVLAITGLSLLLLGFQRTRALWFPLAFLFFMIPVPLAVTEGFRNVLRVVTTIFSQQLLEIVGVPVYREGTLLLTTGASVEIADACSGFSTLIAMIAIGSLYAYISASVLWERVLLVAASILLAIIVNIVRVFFIILLGLRFGFQILDTAAHPASGVVTFALAFFLLVLAHWGISRVMKSSHKDTKTRITRL